MIIVILDVLDCCLFLLVVCGSGYMHVGKCWYEQYKNHLEASNFLIIVSHYNILLMFTLIFTKTPEPLGMPELCGHLLQRCFLLLCRSFPLLSTFNARSVTIRMKLYYPVQNFQTIVTFKMRRLPTIPIVFFEFLYSYLFAVRWWDSMTLHSNVLHRSYSPLCIPLSPAPFLLIFFFPRTFSPLISFNISICVYKI